MSCCPVESLVLVVAGALKISFLRTFGDVASWVDGGFGDDVALLDFSNVFDVVSHSVLLNKLRCIGVSDFVLD